MRWVPLSELSEGNNQRAVGPIEIALPDPPDLVVSEVSGPTAAQPGRIHPRAMDGKQPRCGRCDRRLA